MTKLAIYDKTVGVRDKKSSQYFKWDYIYFKNANIRIGVFFGCLVLALFYIGYVFIIKKVDILSLDIKAEAVKIGLYTAFTLVVYTLIGTIAGGIEYEKSKERLSGYMRALGRLNDLRVGSGTNAYLHSEEDTPQSKREKSKRRVAGQKYEYTLHAPEKYVYNEEDDYEYEEHYHDYSTNTAAVQKQAIPATPIKSAHNDAHTKSDKLRKKLKGVKKGGV